MSGIQHTNIQRKNPFLTNNKTKQKKQTNKQTTKHKHQKHHKQHKPRPKQLQQLQENKHNNHNRIERCLGEIPSSNATPSIFHSAPLQPRDAVNAPHQPSMWWKR